MTSADAAKHSVLNSSFPVLLPRDEALFMPAPEFQTLVKDILANVQRSSLKELQEEIEVIDANTSAPRPKAPFIQGLEKHEAHHRTPEDLQAENKTLTENADVTNISSKNPLVDLFYDLGENTAGDELKKLLDNAWKEDALLTLKIIFNARSIPLGKSNRISLYKAFGWLAENHPLTLLTNLRWLVRPVIEKKAPKVEDKEKSKDGDDKEKSKDDEKKEKSKDDEDFDMIGADDIVSTDPAKAHDVRYGLSHGYWKDLLNLVVFAANDQLKFDGDPSSLLNNRNNNKSDRKRKRDCDSQSAKQLRREKNTKQNERVQEKLKNDPFYRTLHISVAKLFADQLKEDKALLDSGKKSDLKKLSLAAKWAPTFGEFHDKHTFILSSIAECIFPDPASFSSDANNRELYLRQVRELYRKQYASPLRKALSIVERDIAAKKFEDIKYEQVPSLAMDRYAGLFMKNDFDRFKDYVQAVAKGTAKISGATLMPSTLVSKARKLGEDLKIGTEPKNLKAVKARIYADVVDGQWKTLLQRVRDAGTLQSSIAICDVSGSMSSPQFKDGSCPMDSAIGLSILISEVTAPPFGGGFITFSETPKYMSLSDKGTKGLTEQVSYIENGSAWGYSTNFVAVFEDIILPMAIENKLKPEDMVKQIFVFSDMQFNEAENSSDKWTSSSDEWTSSSDKWTSSSNKWTSSYERIKQKYTDAGYTIPRLVFWNLAAEHTDKPTTMDDQNTALVSGYSQGMLKAFLESGTFEDEGEDEDEIEEEMVEGEDGVVEVMKVKKKIDPITVVRKTLDHKAYGMLEVVD